jgi:LacI family repressor for deo operon, udp, cdd, tsx, nupC, and nupG
MEVATNIMDTAYTLGYNSMIIVKKNYTNYESFENLFKNVSIAGIIMHTGIVDPNLVNELQLHYPVVMCSDYIENMDISYVSINDVAAAKAATNYLISTGHTKIALVNCNPSFRYSKHRENGYMQALSEAGLNINENWIIRLSTSSYFLALSYIRQMLERPDRPDAIFACSDTYGMAAINAAQQLGIKVPEELSVIGFDNTSASSMTNPTLTTVAQPMVQLGSQACELLIEKIRTKNTANQQIILDTELVVRNSTCPKNI